MKVKLSIPTDLSDIKLSQYQKFLKTTKDKEDNAFIERQLVGIFCGISDELVSKIAKRDFDNIVRTITDMLSKESESTPIPIIKHNGKEYGFIPKIDEITVGEQADIDSMIGDWSKMDKVMGVLYRPIKVKSKKGYLIEDYEPNSLDLTMDVVNRALVFFYNLLSDLQSCTLSYIKEEVVKKNSQILEKNGVGINQFTQSLEETFLNMKELLSYHYIRHSSF